MRLTMWSSLVNCLQIMVRDTKSVWNSKDWHLKGGTRSMIFGSVSLGQPLVWISTSIDGKKREGDAKLNWSHGKVPVCGGELPESFGYCILLELTRLHDIDLLKGSEMPNTWKMYLWTWFCEMMGVCSTMSWCCSYLSRSLPSDNFFFTLRVAPSNYSMHKQMMAPCHGKYSRSLSSYN